MTARVCYSLAAGNPNGLGLHLRGFLKCWSGRWVVGVAQVFIRDLAYEVEYLISSHVSGSMHVWYLNLRLPALIQKINLARVELELNSEMHNSAATNTFDNEVSFRRSEDPVTLDDNYFVDFNSDITRKILEKLIGNVEEEEEEEQIVTMEDKIWKDLIRQAKEEEEQIVSIVGMPGIGKTTMATKLYNSREVSNHFDLCLWCVASETCGVRNMLIQILMCVDIFPDKNTISKKNVEELRENIQEILSGKRYLIVIDDVLDAEVFEDLKSLPNNKNGSRILITTRMELDKSGHKVPFLSDDQCWDLLVKKVFLKDPCPPELVSIGMRIARRCSGIPLAVVSTADILVNLEKEMSVWETVEEQLDTLLLDGESNYRKRLELSYKHLDYPAKPCLLYLATFPKGAEISREQLSWMWIAEGYIEDFLEERAETYFYYIVAMGLMLPAKRDTEGRIVTVKIHDMLHEFCARKAYEENFLKSTYTFSIYERHQHLCVPSASSISFRPFGLHCRSLRGCSRDLQSSSFQTMPLLKVIDLSPNENVSILYPRFKLPVQLKYLGVSDLPKGTVDNLLDLEIIHVRSNKTVRIPSAIARRAKLRHVILKPSAEFEEDFSISETTNLRTLSFVCLYRQKEEEILRHSPHLHKLKCICGGDVIFPDMRSLMELESLKIRLEISLRDIEVPNFNFPDTLKKLCLSGAVLTGEQMSILGRIRKLRVLKLEGVTLVGDVWEVRGNDEFNRLIVLKVESRDLRVLTWGKYSSWLECLVVTGCTKLEHIRINSKPNLVRLKTIEVTKCGPGAYISAARISQRKREVANKMLNLVTDKKMEQILLQNIELHDQNTVDTSSTELSIYLKEHGPRNSETCTYIVHYAMQFHSYMDHLEFHDVGNAAMGLVRIAQSYRERKDRLEGYSNHRYEMEKKQGEFSELFVNSFIPEVQKLFKVSKMHQLSKEDKHLNRNEILAAFFNFLIQVLYREENISSGEEQQLYTLIRNQLSFHLAVLGDIPFQPTHPGLEEQVNNLLDVFELLANEAGSFIYSCVFSVRPLDADWFIGGTIKLLVQAEFLNTDIKHHCNMFSELPIFISPRSVVDSFFIFDSLIDDIENLENCEINFVDDNEKKSRIGMLKDGLNNTKSLMKVTDQISGGAKANEQKEELIRIRDLAYQAEYLINSHAVGNIPAWYLNLRLPSIVQEIQIVNERLLKENKMQGGNARKLSDGEASSGTPVIPATMGDSDFLIFDDYREKDILDDLCRSSEKSRKIISITGMPGLGKTTTATKLYNCREISEYFDRRVWCVVSQSYSLRALFVQILRDITADGNNQDLAGKETAELGVSIHKNLYGKRYLIVLDDVWDSDVLDSLIRQLPDGIHGSRVIVTSRNKGVAPDDSIFHSLPLLSDNQCWDLLMKKVFPNPRESWPLQLDDVGKQIAKQCCGIPLAVVTTAGILANLDKERSVWERVAEQLDVLLLVDGRNYRSVLELSYEHLPHYLKPCFLYFAAFPEDEEISKKMLIWMWVSARFIPNDGKKSPEEIAETYFLDLINRNLVMTAKRGFDGRIRTCRIHDLLRDICVAKANEENFIKSTDISSLYEKHQGLYPLRWGPISLPFSFQFRYLRGYPTYYQTMPLLKTVEFPLEEYDSCPIFDLPVQLRYLGILGELQKRMVANLVNLEFIQVRNNKVYVPYVVLRMVKLRHLLIREEGEFEEDCSSKMTQTTNLRSLSYVCLNRKKDQDVLRHSPHLQELKCKIGGDEIFFPDLSALSELESLRIDYTIDHFSFAILLSESSFPSTIKKLYLKYSAFPWEKMSIVGKLPKLQVMKLEDMAFVGEVWQTNEDEFQELRFLKIDLLGLEQWSTESSHFPSLEKLVMERCYDMEEIPTDLGYIQSLQRITVKDCNDRVKASAEKIKEEQLENGNTQLQVDC